MTARRVAVVGLGLMGGSLARALAALDVRVLGYDADAPTLAQAVAEGIVHEPLARDLAETATADVVVLAVPVGATCALLDAHGARIGAANTLVMDVASTKRSIVAAAERSALGARYVGAHPLTGSHRSGWGASQATLFDNARVFLCPTRDTAPEMVERATQFWRALRAGVELLDAAEHDEQMAWRSHLPHVLSSALACTLQDALVSRAALGPGGRDMTRLAGGSPTLWTSIAMDNAAALANAMEHAEARLRDLRERLRMGDERGVQAFFRDGCDWFEGTPGGVRTMRRTES